jgi:hypothetical protein
MDEANRGGTRSRAIFLISRPPLVLEDAPRLLTVGDIDFPSEVVKYWAGEILSLSAMR